MRLFNKIKPETRENVASVLQSEVYPEGGRKYQDRLVEGHYDDFLDNYSRREVCLNDAVGERVTFGFLKHVFEKLPKFCADDEVVSDYIMEDVRDAIQKLNLKPKLIIAGANCVINGWTLVKWLVDEYSLGCKIFGYEETHPRYWKRYTNRSRVNKIEFYRAIYIPRPMGMNNNFALNEERYILYPNDPSLQHLTRLDRNYGIGYSRLQPIWDAITKLRENSDANHFLNSNFMQLRYPQQWTPSGKAQKFAEKVRKANRTTGLAIEAVTNPQTGEDTGLPSVQYRPWGQGPQGQKIDDNKASAFLDGEWLRLLANLGYSQGWATGGNAGALEGSEINLTRDDRADIAEFSILEPVYKDIFKRLAELGVMEKVGVSAESIQLLLSKEYTMVSWLTWEYNDKAALQQEQLDHEMEMEKGSDGDRNAYDKEKDSKSNTRENASVRYNNKVEERLLYSIVHNAAMPMTPVMSAWLRRIGFEDNELFMETHDGKKYSKPRGDAEQQYHQWTASGSKGGYYWDHFVDRAPPWHKIGAFPENLEAGYGEDSFDPEQEREFKMEGDEATSTPGLGTSRDVYHVGDYDADTTYHVGDYDDDTTYFSNPSTGTMATPSAPTGTQQYNPTDKPFAFAADKSGPGRKRSPGRKAPGHISREFERESNPYGKKSPYPVAYNEKFKEVLNSKSALLRFAKNISTDHNPTGWSMKSVTPYKIRELVNELAKASIRVNRVSFGNSVKAGYPYNYGGEDEFICPKSYKLNIGKKVPLGIYHNLDVPGKPSLPEWQVIGTHEVLGWDDELGQEIAKNEYDETKINGFFEKRGETNWIQPYLDAGEEPPISGAYTTYVIKHNGKNFQTQIDLKSVSFVPDANCPWGICNFKPEVK